MDKLAILSLLLSCAALSRADMPPTWNVTNPTNNNVCVLASFNADLEIKYFVNGSDSEFSTVKVTVPVEKAALSPLATCSGKNTKTFALMWSEYNHTIQMSFTQQGGAFVAVDRVSFIYDLNDSGVFPNANVTDGRVNATGIPTAINTFPETSHFQCMSGVPVQLGYMVNITLTNVRLEAFRSSTNDSFSKNTTTCTADSNSTTPVPTAPTTTPTTTAETTTVMTTVTSTVTTGAPTNATTEEPTTMKPVTTPTTPTQPPTEPPTTEAPTTSAPAQTRWSVKNSDTGVVCILLESSLEMTVPYTAVNQVSKNQTYLTNSTIYLPQEAKVVQDGSFCSAYTVQQHQQIKLQFGAKNHNITVRFAQNNMTGVISVDEIAFEYDLSDSAVFPNASLTYPMQRTAANNVFVTIPKDKYYVCSTASPVVLNNTEEDFQTSAVFTNLKVEAFRNSTSTEFDGGASVCPWEPSTTPTPTTPTTPLPINVARYALLNATDGSLCLYAQFGLSVRLTYVDVNGTHRIGDIVNVNNGSISNMSSSCEPESAKLVIVNWIPDWILTLNFTRSSDKFSLTNVILSYNLKDSTVIHGANETMQHVSMNDVSKWSAKVGHSYKCSSAETWKLNTTGVSDVPELNLVFENIQVQPFMNGNGTHPQFGDAEECAGPTSDIVPIAVGCALAALVVIVLIAYVIGRRRNRARGYESM